MKLGLIGIQRSPDLCLLKKRIEDRGHRATFLNLRKVPEYTLSSLTPSSIRFDHMDLLDFDCFYTGELEVRNRFFRGSFGREIWATLRDRYLDFAQSERDNIAYQLSLLLSLEHARPCINRPEACLRSRLRPSVLRRLSREGLRTTTFSAGLGGQPEAVSERLRIRTEEDHMYDVPFFPRQLKGCIGVSVTAADTEWRAIVVKGHRASAWIGVRSGVSRAEEMPGEIGKLGEQVLDALDLELAEILLARGRQDFDIVDVRPVPDISGFEEITGEAISDSVVERLLFAGGSR